MFIYHLFISFITYLYFGILVIFLKIWAGLHTLLYVSVSLDGMETLEAILNSIWDWDVKVWMSKHFQQVAGQKLDIKCWC